MAFRAAAHDFTGRWHELDAAGALADQIAARVFAVQAALAELAALWMVVREGARHLVQRIRPARQDRAA